MTSELLSDLIGAKYERHGRGPTYDCYGLAIEVSRRLGNNIPSFPSCNSDEGNHKAIESKLDLFVEVPSPEFGCLALLTLTSNYPTHIGVVLEYPNFIHVMEGRNVVIEKLNSLFWKSRVKGFYT